MYVMLPLDAGIPGSPGNILWKSALPRLADINVHGVMVDIWWGLCEADAPGRYNFSEYVDLVKTCAELGLKVQATCSFHACGGNIGDDVNIPLPQWLVDVADEHALWYKDRAGSINRECLSLSADHVRVLPTANFPPAEQGTSHEHGNENGNENENGGADQEQNPQAGVVEEQNIAGESENTAVDSAVEPENDPGSENAADQVDSGAYVGEVVNSVVELEERSMSMSFVSTEEDEQTLRTPLIAYAHFISAFLNAVGPEYVGSTVVELQIGCGPCGELRYPSYPLSDGKWTFPGIGELQCFDNRMLHDLRGNARAAGLPESWGVPPSDTGSYNDTPGATEFYSRGHSTSRGTFFLSWYADCLLRHARDMLDMADGVVQQWSGLTLAVKVSGIHWWKLTSSRAAEANCGYYISRRYNSYKKIAQLLAEYNAVMDFTCLEMRTIDQPFRLARCAPKQLVQEVFGVARKANVRVAGENALERYDWTAYSQIIKAFRSVPKSIAYGFTFLRLGPTLLEDANFELFKKFVGKMRHL